MHLIDEAYPPENVADVTLAMAGVWLRETQNLDPIVVGHRVVHGGSKVHCARLTSRDI
jgi:acetate kinase